MGSMDVLVTVIIAGYITSTIGQSPGFVEGPNKVDTEENGNVMLMWTLNQPFPASHDFTIFHGNTTADNNTIVKLLFQTICVRPLPKANCVYNTSSPNKIGFNITSVAKEDARFYTCLWDTLGGTLVSDSDALIYIPKPPSVPAITGPTTVPVNQSFTLSCNSIPQSLPLSVSASAAIQYTWNTTLPHVINGAQITVGPLTIEHNGKTVRCDANEDRYTTLISSSDVFINVTGSCDCDPPCANDTVCTCGDTIPYCQGSNKNCADRNECIIPATVVPICGCLAIGLGVGLGLKKKRTR